MGELLMVAGALRNFQNLTNWYGSSEHDMLPTDDLFYALSPEPGLEQQSPVRSLPRMRWPTRPPAP